VRPQLARLPGVAIVGVAGGKTREFHVTIDPDKLAAHNVSATQVADAIRNSNIIVSPGLIEENHQLELALISGQAKRPEELNNIVVATVNNAPVLVSEVATVSGGVEPQFTIVTADGHPAALVNINRQPDANTVAVADEVKAALNAMRGQIPKDVRVAAYYDQSLLVRESINSVRDSILIGLLLSVVILYAFLRNWGTTFVAIHGTRAPQLRPDDTWRRGSGDRSGDRRRHCRCRKYLHPHVARPVATRSGTECRL
jgi:multidrug efflux pump subunit AcrB